MHYIPESTCEMLRGDGSLQLDEGRSNFHYLSAPLYVLTVCVAALLVIDWATSVGAANVSPQTVSQTATDSSSNAVIPTGSILQTPSNVLFGFRFALLAAILGGARIFYHALDGLLSGKIGADLALTIACLSAIILGEHQAAGLVVLISLIGESLEGYTMDRARWAVRETYSLQPTIAHLTRDGRERDISISELGPGDFVVIRPGERVPVDGRVVAGKSVIDQSPFT
ncbi:MAG: hypothetical protein FJ267_03115, partial [Planctomycetes bacterium]|nr:hypothetical protein [Planctomycetota bacterium]